ncbi:MAG: malto-oligosyltrehalose trehalohydrolase [Comamonadaceae bacterium]|nr:MAG: malto-oligosyltrehalose trehalohydrolase [Comamonadaceae bacterium]
MSALHDMPYGARMLAGGGARFGLWAPAARTASVLLQQGGEVTEPLPATPGDGGWWHVDAPQATAATQYRWLIDGTLEVPDPAARHAPQGPHGWCTVTDPQGYAWRTSGWKGRPWAETVLYELHVGSFTAEGTYAAALVHLPRLADMGFTAIELMPLATFGGDWGWGYDGVLPFAPHPGYGTPDELKYFVDAAHALGLSVFLDVVYNHFGPDGNYLNAYAPAFFSPTHESPWGQGLNFDQPGSAPVREFFIHNALYWIEEFRIDGLRLDAVHAIVDDSHPHLLQDISQRVREFAAEQGRFVHLVLENDRNQPHWLSAQPCAPGRYDAQWNDDFHHALHVALTGESHTYYARFAQDPLALLARVLAHGFAFVQGQTPRPGDAPAPLQAMVQFTGNHDQVGNRAFGERLAALVQPEAAELAQLLALLTPATPLVFMGDEFGAQTPFLYFAHWEGELRAAVQAGRQREFSHAVPPGNTLPDPCAASTLQASRLDWVQAELPAARQRSELVRLALESRRAWLLPRAPWLCTTGHHSERVGATGLRICWRYTHGESCWLEINLGNAPVEGVPPRPTGHTWFQHRWADDSADGTAPWAPWSARWIGTR